MMEFKITIELPGIPEALKNLAEAIRRQSVANTENIPTTPTTSAEKLVEAVKTETAIVTPPTASNASEAVPATVEAPVKVEAVEEPVEAPAPVQTKKLTQSAIAAAGATLISQGKMGEVLALLGRYKVQAITQLKDDVYPAFADELRALGADL